jgi:hypothetical protein
MAFVVAMSATSGCSSPTRDWQAALAKNSIKGYQAYITKYPDGPFREDANQRLQTLRWSHAQSDGTVESYRQFLALSPQADFAFAAQANIDMATRFSLEVLSDTTTTWGECLKPGADVLLAVTSLPHSGTVATLSALTAQAQSATGEWIQPRAFVIKRRSGVTINDSVLVTSCMTAAGYPVFYFQFDRIGSPPGAVLAQYRSAMSMMFAPGGSLQLRLLFETATDSLHAIRAFGQTRRLAQH